MHPSLTVAATEISDVAARARQSLVLVHDGRRGAGAGVVWRADGLIVTNHHVVAGRPPRVTLADDREFPARLIASDPAVDLALLRVEAIGLPAAPTADARAARVGQIVLAIGNPWGQRGVVTGGIISGLGEITMPGGRRADYIRTDAALAPGNSGGPLIDASGAVLGINAMILGGDRGVAIPSHVVAAFVAEAVGRRALLGVGVQPVPLPAAIGQGQAAGLLVVELVPDGPAARAGLLVGDILLAVGDERLETPRALTRALAGRQGGERVPLRLLRGGQPLNLAAELAELERAA